MVGKLWQNEVVTGHSEKGLQTMSKKNCTA